jgi:hypothetical protein
VNRVVESVRARCPAFVLVRFPGPLPEPNEPFHRLRLSARMPGSANDRGCHLLWLGVADWSCHGSGSR